MVSGKKLETPHGNARYRIYWSQLFHLSCLATISGMTKSENLVSFINLTNIVCQMTLLTFFFFFPLHLILIGLFRVVNDTLESMSLDLGFSGSTLAEGTLCHLT